MYHKIKCECSLCVSKRQAGWMLNSLPEEGDANWNDYTEYEQDYILAVRSSVRNNQILTREQYAGLRQIYNKRSKDK